MSLTDTVTSTVSSVFNNILIVVNDGNNTISRNGNGNNASNGYSNAGIGNDTNPLPTAITAASSPAPQMHAVADGVPETQLIAVMVMLAIFSVFGCLGNGLVLYVFTKKSDKVTSTIFILALAWTDFFTCLIIMPFTVTNVALNSKLNLDFFCKLYNFLITSNVPLSAFIMVAIAMDRYFSICHPFLHAVTPRRARISILCLVLFACSLGSITACLYGVWKYDNATETVRLGETPWCKNGTFNITLDGSGHDLGKSPHLGPQSDVVTESTLFSNSMVEILITNDSHASWGMNNSKGSVYDTSVDGQQECTRSTGELELVYTGGLCTMNDIIFSSEFARFYQKIYISFYIISLLSVFTLYFFIYRSVVQRRAWRRKQKSLSHSPMTMTAAVTHVDNGNKTKMTACNAEEEHLELAPKSTLLTVTNAGEKDQGSVSNATESSDMSPGNKPNSDTTANTAMIPAANNKKAGAQENGVETSTLTTAAEKKANRERRDFNFLANIRTAIMLFVVALVFIISFLPAWLMATGLITFQIIIFYMHFIYNVANPVIYAFMNQSFRKELKRVFQRGTHLLRGG